MGPQPIILHHRGYYFRREYDPDTGRFVDVPLDQDRPDQAQADDRTIKDSTDNRS